jgi:hypothetical protein
MGNWGATRGAVPARVAGISDRKERSGFLFFGVQKQPLEKRPQVRHAAINGGSFFLCTALFCFVGAENIMKYHGYKAFGSGTFISRQFL